MVTVNQNQALLPAMMYGINLCESLQIFTRCKKFLFNFASTLCNFLRNEFTHIKNVDASIIAQKLERVIRTFLQT